MLRFVARSIVTAVVGLLVSAAPGDALVLTELMPSNDSTITDEDGDFSDWIEVFNDGEVAANELAPVQQAQTDIYARDANGKPYSPSWYTLNLKAAYQIGPKTSFTAGWENITNQRYRPYSSGIVAAGSNFIFSVRRAL